MTTNLSTAGRALEIQAGTAAVAGWATVLCAVHCILTPILITFLPGLGLPESVEWGALIVSATLAFGIVVRLPRSRAWRLALIGMGAAIWFASLSELLGPIPEPVGSSFGAILIAGTLLHVSKCCREQACLCQD